MTAMTEKHRCWGDKPYMPSVLVASTPPTATRVPFSVPLQCTHHLTDHGRNDPKCEGCCYKGLPA